MKFQMIFHKMMFSYVKQSSFIHTPVIKTLVYSVKDQSFCYSNIIHETFFRIILKMLKTGMLKQTEVKVYKFT